MKKIFFSVCLTLVSMSAFAQKQGDIAVGGHFTYGFDMEMAGIGAKGQYNFTNQIRGEAAFEYFFEKKHVSCWDIQANVHYLFDLADQIKLYPLAGLGYMRSTVDIPKVSYMGIETGGGSSSSGDVFFNLGGGVQYDLNEKLAIGADLKYQFKKDGQLCISAGIIYKL